MAEISLETRYLNTALVHKPIPGAALGSTRNFAFSRNEVELRRVLETGSGDGRTGWARKHDIRKMHGHCGGDYLMDGAIRFQRRPRGE